MENFYNWIMQPVPEEDVIIWFNIHNMNYEKIELYGDFAKSLHQLIIDTYLGYSINETKIELTDEDNQLHFDWCWSQNIENFKKEKINFNLNGEHKDYFQSFFVDIFYNQKSQEIRDSIRGFLYEIFNINMTYSKSDLDLLTDLYKMMEKNLE